MPGNINTDWEGVPHTDKRAHPNGNRTVRNVRAVRISSGSIRCAPVTDAIFEIATDAVDPYKDFHGDHRIEVKCLWYGCKPSKSWMHIKITGTCQIIEHYTGPVVSDFGR